MATVNGFINRTAELEFILTKIDGVNRNELLGVKRLHYVNEAVASTWYESLKQESTNCSSEAHKNLDFIYRIMVSK